MFEARLLLLSFIFQNKNLSSQSACSVQRDEYEEDINEYKIGYDFYKNSKDEKIWRVETPGQKGPFLFSFDQETIFNFCTDYPDKLTPEQIEIFKKKTSMAALK